MGYDGQGLGKKREGSISLIVVEPRLKHEGLGFDGREEKIMSTKIIFVKEKDMAEFACSSEERVALNEDGSMLPAILLMSYYRKVAMIKVKILGLHLHLE
jgi:hypothetical protein